MSIPATEATGTTGTTSTTATSTGPFGPASTGSSADKDMFLQLLVAQLRYQDPMNPTDSSEFLAQSAQFTALEKMQSVADQTSLLLGVQMAFGASGLMGQQVSYGLADGTQGAGTVRGVTFGAGGPVLDVDGTSVPMTGVLSVGTAAPPTDPATATTADPADPTAPTTVTTPA